MNTFQTFNKRFKCNTECRKLEDGTDEKVQCEKDFCEGFVKPKTKEQQEEEELKKLAEQYDYGTACCRKNMFPANCHYRIDFLEGKWQKVAL